MAGRIKKPVMPKVPEESYFATCERDEGGQCLPKGESDHSRVFPSMTEEELQKPYEQSEDLPFVNYTTPRMSTYIQHMAQDLMEPRLLKMSQFASGSGYDGMMVPCGDQRRLGLLSYDNPLDLSDLEDKKGKLESFGPDNFRARAWPNFTIFKDAGGNWSAAWGDPEKVKFLIDKFSDRSKLTSLKSEEHKKLGGWFGYKEDAVGRWISKQKGAKKKAEPTSVRTVKIGEDTVPVDKNGRFVDPYGQAPQRSKVPQFGYHVTELEALPGIAKEGLKPQVSSTGGGGGGKVAAVYFADNPQNDASNPPHSEEVLIRANTHKVNGVLDDPEVREYYKLSGTEPGENTAFMVGQRIEPKDLEVMVISGGKVTWMPLDKYLKANNPKEIAGREQEKRKDESRQAFMRMGVGKLQEFVADSKVRGHQDRVDYFQGIIDEMVAAGAKLPKPKKK